MQQERSRAALQGRCSKGGAGDPPVTALGLRAPVASQGHATRSPQDTEVSTCASSHLPHLCSHRQGCPRKRPQQELREPEGVRGQAFPRAAAASHPFPTRLVCGQCVGGRAEGEAALERQPRIVLQKLKFSLSWRNAGLGRAAPFLAQDTGFPEPGHGQHHQQSH